MRARAVTLRRLAAMARKLGGRLADLAEQVEGPPTSEAECEDRCAALGRCLKLAPGERGACPDWTAKQAAARGEALAVALEQYGRETEYRTCTGDELAHALALYLELPGADVVDDDDDDDDDDGKGWTNMGHATCDDPELCRVFGCGRGCPGYVWLRDVAGLDGRLVGAPR